MTEDKIDCDPNDEHHDAYRWIADNPIETDQQYKEERKQTRRKASSSSEGKTIPPILTWDDMMSDLETTGLPPELIEGVLHKGCRACISGSSKAGKTWTLVNLAVAAASGSEWLGRPTIESKILYLDFELHRSFAQQRFKWVREKLQAD